MLNALSPACPHAHLHMAIHGFVLEEFTKPVHEHQFPTLRKPSSLSSTGSLKKATKPKNLNLKPITKRDLVWTLIGILTISAFSMLIMIGLTKLSNLYPDIISSNFSPPFLEFPVLDKTEYWIYLVWIPFFFFNIFGEELLWRGFILPRQKVKSETANWTLNSFGWLLFHLAFGWKLMILLLPILIINPFIVQKTKNTWTGILIHGLLNGSGFLLITLGVLNS